MKKWNVKTLQIDPETLAAKKREEKEKQKAIATLENSIVLLETKQLFMQADKHLDKEVAVGQFIVDLLTIM